MNEGEIIKKLKKEFKEVYIWEDKPNIIYKKHSHSYKTKLLIVNGNMIIKKEGKEIDIKSGDSIIINRNELHEAIIGSNGCKYIVAEKEKTT